MKINYEAKITKAKSWVNVWSRRDLTLMGKVTIIKSLIYSQFSYLAIPLIQPSSSLIKMIDTLTFNFLWGCKRDKIKREVVKRRVNEIWLDIFDFSVFLTSLKLTLIKKVINPNFTHNWKRVFIQKLKFPHFIEISIENALTHKSCKVVQDTPSNFLKVLIVCINGWLFGFCSPSHSLSEFCILYLLGVKNCWWNDCALWLFFVVSILLKRGKNERKKNTKTHKKTQKSKKEKRQKKERKDRKAKYV